MTTNVNNIAMVDVDNFGGRHGCTGSLGMEKHLGVVIHDCKLCCLLSANIYVFFFLYQRLPTKIRFHSMFHRILRRHLPYKVAFAEMSPISNRYSSLSGSQRITFHSLSSATTQNMNPKLIPSMQ